MSFWAIYVSNAIKYFSPSHVLPGLISFRKSNRFPAAERLQSIEIARKCPVLAAWALPAYCAVPASRSTVPFKSLGPRPVLQNQLYYSRLRRWYTPSIRPILYLRCNEPITSKGTMQYYTQYTFYHPPSTHSVLQPVLQLLALYFIFRARYT